MVPESSLQLKMLIYNNYESINLQKKLWDNAMRVHSQILHKCARTTEIIRDEIQKSEESITFLAKKYGVSRPTIYKWTATA